VPGRASAEQIAASVETLASTAEELDGLVRDFEVTA
jgi:methyl-accepting chemotaxis protein